MELVRFTNHTNVYMFATPEDETVFLGYMLSREGVMPTRLRNASTQIMDERGPVEFEYLLYRFIKPDEVLVLKHTFAADEERWQILPGEVDYVKVPDFCRVELILHERYFPADQRPIVTDLGRHAQPWSPLDD